MYLLVSKTQPLIGPFCEKKICDLRSCDVYHETNFDDCKSVLCYRIDHEIVGDDHCYCDMEIDLCFEGGDLGRPENSFYRYSAICLLAEMFYRILRNIAFVLMMSVVDVV